DAPFDDNLGIYLRNGASSTYVGGTVPAPGVGYTSDLTRNIIVGQKAGVKIEKGSETGFTDPSFNYVTGNYIGLDYLGKKALGNQQGIWINGSSENKIYTNVIAGNYNNLGITKAESI